MIVLVAGCAVMLAVAGLMALFRIERGPTMLDRMVAVDMLTSTLVIGVAAEAAWNRRIDTVPLMAAFALIGFTASVIVARFAAVEPVDERRIKTAAEVAAEEAARRQRGDEGEDDDQ